MTYSILAASYIQQGRRPYQEDALYPAEIKPDDRLFMVCDGVGGSKGGALASSMVCRLLPQKIRTNVSSGKDISDKHLTKALDAVMQQMTGEDVAEAATTLTMLYLNREGALVGHIGDSRVYQLRPSKGVIFRTRDHSLVQELLDSGVITEEEARNHPQSNIITQAVHQPRIDEEAPCLEINRLNDIRPGDVFLLCTDGVWGKTTDDRIVEMLLASKPLAERMQGLADLTFDSHDNNTAIAVEILQVNKKSCFLRRVFKKLF